MKNNTYNNTNSISSEDPIEKSHERKVKHKKHKLKEYNVAYINLSYTLKIPKNDLIWTVYEV